MSTMTRRRALGPLAAGFALLLAVSLALPGRPPLAIAAEATPRPTPIAVGFPPLPYQRSMPIALWEVGTDQVGTAPSLGTATT